MSKSRSWWTWLSNPDNRATLALLGGAAVAMVGGAWALYIHFSKPPEIKPAVTGVQIVNIQNIVQQNYSPEQFDAILQKRLKEIMAQLPQADPEKRALLEKELAAIQGKHDNLLKAYEEQKAKLVEAYQALDRFKQELPAEQIKEAQKALTQGQTGAAERLFQQALEKSQSEAEKRTAEAAEAAYQLGRLAESRIHYGQAESYYRQALQLQPNNPVYLNAAGNLNHTLGHYQKSEKFLKRALELREQSLKPDDPDLATSLNNLALLYQAQGKYGEAEPLLKRSLAIKEKALGPEHPDVATCLENYAALLREMGSQGEAAPVEARARAIRAKEAEKNPQR